jgi:hypothetical protein
VALAQRLVMADPRPMRFTHGRGDLGLDQWRTFPRLGLDQWWTLPRLGLDQWWTLPRLGLDQWWTLPRS